MSDLTDILKRVKGGESSFKPDDHSPESLHRFQSIGKALAHASREGLLEHCEFSKDSMDGDLYYNMAIVIGGLSFKGDEYLRQETTLKGWLLKRSPSIFQWVFGIVAGLVLASLISWFVP